MNARDCILALAVVACGGHAKNVSNARYDAELPVLLAETAQVVRRWYPTIHVDPGGTIRTPWQQVPRPRHGDSLYETRTNADRQASRTRFFIRFHITISNTRPSRIEVRGHSAILREGMTIPREFPHKHEPGWTSELADKLRLKIHARLERFAR